MVKRKYAASILATYYRRIQQYCCNTFKRLTNCQFLLYHPGSINPTPLIPDTIGIRSSKKGHLIFIGQAILSYGEIVPSRMVTRYRTVSIWDLAIRGVQV